MSRHRPSWAVILRASALAFVRVGVGVASAFGPWRREARRQLRGASSGGADRDGDGVLKFWTRRQQCARPMARTAAGGAPAHAARPSGRAAIISLVHLSLETNELTPPPPAHSLDNCHRSAMSLFDAPKIVRSRRRLAQYAAVWSGTVLDVDASRRTACAGAVARAAHPSHQDALAGRCACRALCRPRLADPLDVAPGGAAVGRRPVKEQVQPGDDVVARVGAAGDETARGRAAADAAAQGPILHQQQRRRDHLQRDMDYSVGVVADAEAAAAAAAAAVAQTPPHAAAHAAAAGPSADERRQLAELEAMLRAERNQTDSCSRRCAAGRTNGAARSSSASSAPRVHPHARRRTHARSLL